MSLKSFVLAATLGLATASAANATVLTTTVSGTISSVNASKGYFDNIQIGQTFSYTQTFELNSAQTYGGTYTYNDYYCYYGYSACNTYSSLSANTSQLLSSELKVGGQTVAFNNAMTYAGASMSDYSRIGYQDYWTVNSSGYTESGNWGNNYVETYSGANASVQAYGSTGKILDFGSSYRHIVAPGDYSSFNAYTGYYSYSGYNYSNWQANLNGQVETFSFNANDVPEPANLALMALGLLALGVARRRKFSQ